MDTPFLPGSLLIPTSAVLIIIIAANAYGVLTRYHARGFLYTYTHIHIYIYMYVSSYLQLLSEIFLL